jgi:hypothetical protein
MILSTLLLAFAQSKLAAAAAHRGIRVNATKTIVSLLMSSSVKVS